MQQQGFTWIRAFPRAHCYRMQCLCICARGLWSAGEHPDHAEHICRAPWQEQQCCHACLQFQFHYPLLCRAASLAIGYLTALPLLDSRYWRPPAPKQQSAAQHRGVAVQQPCENGNLSSSSIRDQRAGHSSGDSSAAATADKSTDDVTAPQLPAMPMIVTVLGECTAATSVLKTARCAAVTVMLKVCMQSPCMFLTDCVIACSTCIEALNCRHQPDHLGDACLGDHSRHQASWRSIVAPSAVPGIPSAHGAGVRHVRTPLLHLRKALSLWLRHTGMPALSGWSSK